MKVFLIAAVSADGYIAHSHSEPTKKTSRADKRLFVELTKQAGTIVMGGVTFRTIGKALPGRRNIVYSRQEINEPDIEVTQEPPAQLVARLEQEGAEALAVCGGGVVYDMFLKAGVVDELYLTIEPALYGQGVSLAYSLLDLQLRLLDSRLLDENTMLLHYAVAK